MVRRDRDGNKNTLAGGQYVRNEMERLGYGTITSWVSGIPEIETLTDEIGGLPSVEKTGMQPIIFSEYEVNGQETDSEGQLVTYEPDRYDYKIFSDGMERHETEAARIGQGEIYVPVSLNSMFGVELGDEISFLVARNGGRKTFTVKGWFEDPFMGSSMIGMLCWSVPILCMIQITGSGSFTFCRQPRMRKKMQ